MRAPTTAAAAKANTTIMDVCPTLGPLDTLALRPSSVANVAPWPIVDATVGLSVGMATVAFPATGEAEAGTEEEIWGDKDVGEIGVPVNGIADGRTDGTAVGLVVGLPIVVPVEKIVGEGTELPRPPCPMERLSDILNISNPSRSRRKLKGV